MQVKMLPNRETEVAINKEKNQSKELFTVKEICWMEVTWFYGESTNPGKSTDLAIFSLYFPCNSAFFCFSRLEETVLPFQLKLPLVKMHKVFERAYCCE